MEYAGSRHRTQVSSRHGPVGMRNDSGRGLSLAGGGK